MTDTATVQVLGIDVNRALLRRWAGWLAPSCQPFFLTAAEAGRLGLTPDPVRERSPELRDTYEEWNVADELAVVWLDERDFHALPRDTRAELVRAQVRHGRGAVATVDVWTDLLDARVVREQGDGSRFVWWPSLVEPHLDDLLPRWVSENQLPCKRRSVPEEVWRAAAVILPGARALSGTFARGSRGSTLDSGATNCFATVIAATGVRDAADKPFEAWLCARCTAGETEDVPGTVLVWRNTEGTATHAAVILGGGWVLHKPGQEWYTPRQVLTATDLDDLAPPGLTLHRHSLL
ncbi:hypothetical protein SAMN05421678_101225 [Actinopolymorpha cephalotaxi]|uniref:Uncharacterized protein n=1 Tax=Actinopolymorpha cephalotaxi TaxID=504797 RepID=A0A1I2KDI0_9ACTN|nr:hypothetical protein [Actinopolymorpha cephalotaxi]NYH87354.1 hypothetical protein [Actinopolymorpha cephalotaxi]SFF65034.1 hypothetical protein SAMN05421678_101225 [Actinopolymorpha cephalotaxi]